MNIIDRGSHKVELEQHAQAKNSDDIFKTAHNKSGSESGDEEQQEIPQQSKNKAHCFCPILAKEHGEGTAVLFQGLSHKVFKSKNVRDNRKWFYDTLESLEKRWPYLRDSGIHGMLDRQVGKGNAFKGCYNKASFDPTTWYSLTNELVKRAMDEEGKVWFDVSVAVECHSIIAGTIYQNIRYHLLCLLAANPEYTGVPYYKVNKSALARALNRSLSTIKREFSELVKHKSIAVNPKCSKAYTLCNPADLIVPEGMKKHAVKSGSFTERNGSYSEMRTGSSTEKTGSSSEQSGSYSERIGSYSDSNTHLEPFQKHIHKHHSPNASRGVGGVSSDAADAGKEAGHQHTCDNTGSFTVPVKEQGLTPASEGVAFQSIKDIRSSKDKLKAGFSDSELFNLNLEVPSTSRWFITDKMGTSLLQEALAACSEATIISVIAPKLRIVSYGLGKEAGWTEAACEYSFLGSLEITAEAFRLHRSDSKHVLSLFKDCWKEVALVYEAIPELNELTDLPATTKADLLIEQIRRCNKEGWATYSNGDVEFTVSPSKTVGEAARAFFEANPELSAEAVWSVLADCVEVFKLNDKPEKFDPLFYSRRGIRPKFLFDHWDDIKAELAAADKLAS